VLGLHFSKVIGRSMSPKIPQDSYVLVMPWLKILALKRGNIIKVKHPQYGEIIKSVVAIDNDGCIWLQGLDPSSVTMAQMGPISASQVLGKVIKIIAPNSRP